MKNIMPIVTVLQGRKNTVTKLVSKNTEDKIC